MRMPSAVSGRQWPAESPAKKTSPSAAGAQLVRDPVALVADGVAAQPLGELDRRLLDVEARVERADADPHLVVARESSSRSRPARSSGRSRSRARRSMPRGMHLEAARERRVRRLVAVGAEHPAPAERVHDQRSATPRRGRCCTTTRRRRAEPRALDRRGLELRVVLVVEQLAERAVVERREGPGQREAHGRVRGVDARARSKVWRIEPSSPSASSHSVGAAQAEVWRSPTS